MKLLSLCTLLSGVLSVLLPITARAQTAQVRHAPTLNGNVEGSIQMMSAESVTLNGGANITKDLLVPGSPTIRLNGQPSYGGTQDGSGNASPSNYQITLNGNATLRNIVRRTDPVTLPTVGAPTAPSGTVNLSINAANQAINWVTLRNLTLNSSAGYYTVPAGSYGQFTANSGNGFILGVAGATQPSVYNFQSLTFNSGTQLRVVGPVVVNVATGPSLNGGSFGASAQPSWFKLNIQTGNVSLNGSSTLYGSLVAPASTVTLNGNSLLNGTLVCDRLTINGNSTIRLVAPATGNQAPSVSLTAPASGSSFPAPASITLAATAIDLDGSIAKVEFFQGAVSLGVDTVAPFALTLNAVGAGSYSYYARATDNLGASSDSATVTVTVTNPNVPPTVSLTAPADGSSVSAPVTLTLAASAADSDGTIAKVEFYQGTTKLGEDTSSPYQQVTGSLAAGTYEFSAKAFDNGGASTGSTVITITVVTPNQPPVVSITAPADATSFDDPGAFTLKATASDPNGTVTKVEFFKEGVLLGEDTTAPYEFAASGVAIGSYDFVARATDNAGSATDSTAVRLTVAHVNDAPTAASQSLTTSEDTPFTITLTGADPDGDAISFIRTSDPTNGTLTPVSTTVFTYTPSPNFNGTDSFTFKTKDVTLESAPATVQITITPRNDPPIAVPPPPVTVPENGSVAILLGAVDIDSPSLSFGVTANVSHGTFSGSIPNLVYTPAANYSGPDSFTYAVSDGEFFSAPATVNITVTPVNNAPLANSATFTVKEGGAVSITLTGMDQDGDGLTFSIVTDVEVSKGVLSGTAPNLVFTPAVGFSGNASFTFKAFDGQLYSQPAIVSVTVTPNIPPSVTITSPANGANFNDPASFTLRANASDSDGVIAKVQFLQNGVLLGEASSAPYEFPVTVLAPGEYSYVARATDNLGARVDSEPVHIVVTHINRSPEATDLTLETSVNAPVEFSANASDSDGDFLTITFNKPLHGNVTVSDLTNTFTYTPDSNFAGPDSTTFSISDGIAAPVIRNLAVNIINHPPIAQGSSFSLSEDIPTTIRLVGFDPDGQPLSFAVTTQATHGILAATSDPEAFTYTPESNYSGPDSLTFTVSDGSFVSAPADATITIVPVNDAPTANSFTVSVNEDSAVTVKLTGSDIDSEGLTFSKATDPAHGTIYGNAPDLRYVPNPGYHGADSFTYTASDGELTSSPADVTITVEPPPVIITTPANGVLANGTAIHVTGTTAKMASSVKVNNVAATLSGDGLAFSADVPITEGANTITAVAFDSQGASASTNVNVTRDTESPRIAIDSPINGRMVSTDHVTVTGIINDTVIGTVNSTQAAVQVNGVTATVVNRTFVATGVPLSPGNNLIVASATDRAANVGTASINVIYHNSPTPKVQIVAGDEQTAKIGSPLPIPLTVVVSDGTGAPAAGKEVIFKVVQNDGQLSAGGRTARSVVVVTDQDGHASANFQLGTRIGVGNHQVNAMVVGFPIEALFRESATPAPPGLIVSDSGNRQSAAPGRLLANPFVAIVVDEGHNRLGGVPVTFTVTEGGGNFGGLPSKTVTTDSDGRALATLTVGLEEGIENNRVEATYAGNTRLPVAFVASGLTPGPVSETEVSGVILDNSDVPVPGATVKINGTDLTTVSDDQGQFSLKPAPVGTIRLDVYGNTVTRPPGSWVNLDFALTTVAGRNNTIGMPIRLLPMELGNSVAVGTNYGGTITLPEYPGFSLKLLPGSVTFPGGSKVGSVSVTVVHNDKTPEVPNFGQQPRFIVSINPKRCIFSPAAQMCLPNLDGLPPGKKTEMYSWDDDLNAFVSIGTGTVTEDGTQICTDPGIGVIKGGWHCGGDPSVAGGAKPVTCDLKKPTISEVQVSKTLLLSATGAPIPSSGNAFFWDVSFAGIDESERGEVLLSQKDREGNSDLTVKGIKLGKVDIVVKYRCLNGTWSPERKVRLTVVPSAIAAVDANGDGTIRITTETDSSDETSAAKSMTFGLNKQFSTTTGGKSMNYLTPLVDGLDDLANFIPVYLSFAPGLTDVMKKYPPSNGYQYTLSNDDNAYNFIHTNLNNSNLSMVAVRTLPDGFGPQFDVPAWKAPTTQVTSSGVDVFATSSKFEALFELNGGGVILVEARGLTKKPLVFQIKKGDTVVTKADVYLDVRALGISKMLGLYKYDPAKPDQFGAYVDGYLGNPDDLGRVYVDREPQIKPDGSPNLVDGRPIWKTGLTAIDFVYESGMKNIPAGAVVRWEFIDPDDKSDDVAGIDPDSAKLMDSNGTSEDDNQPIEGGHLGENWTETPESPSSYFVKQIESTSYAYARNVAYTRMDSSGNSRVRFHMTPVGGNNYSVKATLLSDESESATVLKAGDSSGVFTVWKLIHLENDRGPGALSLSHGLNVLNATYAPAFVYWDIQPETRTTRNAPNGGFFSGYWFGTSADSIDNAKLLSEAEFNHIGTPGWYHVLSSDARFREDITTPTASGLVFDQIFKTKASSGGSSDELVVSHDTDPDAANSINEAGQITLTSFSVPNSTLPQDIVFMITKEFTDSKGVKSTRRLSFSVTSFVSGPTSTVLNLSSPVYAFNYDDAGNDTAIFLNDWGINTGDAFVGRIYAPSKKGVTDGAAMYDSVASHVRFNGRVVIFKNFQNSMPANITGLDSAISHELGHALGCAHICGNLAALRPTTRCVMHYGGLCIRDRTTLKFLPWTGSMPFPSGLDLCADHIIFIRKTQMSDDTTAKSRLLKW